LLTHLSLAAQFGRKPAMFALWLILACSVLCESLARHWQVWVSTRSWVIKQDTTVLVEFEADIGQFVAKLFSGIGVGSLQFITPTYVSEVAPPRIRGMLLVLYNFW
jgi:MFS family permease